MEKRKRQQIPDEDTDEQYEGPSRNSGKKLKSNSKPSKPFTQKNGFDKPKKFPKKEEQEDKKENSQFKRLKFLYNDLMRKIEGDENSIAKVKYPIVNQILSLISGVFQKIVLKHDGCRIVQGCLKYGSEEHRKKILNAFINKNITELSK